MADEETKKDGEEAEAEGARPRKKKGLFLGGGVVGLIGLAYCTFLMAVPGVEERPELDGPFMTELLGEEGEVSVNLTGHSNSHYLQVRLRAEYSAYEEAYVMARTTDPLYVAMLTDRTIVLLSGKTKEDVDGVAGKDVLREELRTELGPILFPVHVGDTTTPSHRDPESGLTVGLSSDKGTMRGLFHDHVLKVDGPGRTIALDEGEPVAFDGDEMDLMLTDAQGDTLYVDVSGLDPGFEGEVQVGVHGRIRSVYFSKLMTQ